MLKLRSSDSVHDAASALARIYRVLAFRGKVMAAGQTAQSDMAAEIKPNGIDDAMTEVWMNSNVDSYSDQLTPD